MEKPVESYEKCRTIVKASIEDRAHEDIWQCFEEIANGSDADSSVSSDMDSQTIGRQGSERTRKKAAIYELEIEKYLQLPLISRQEDPLTWWKYSRKEYPNLFTLAMKYLCAPPSSVNSERVFSASGNIYVENRNRLLPDNAEMLLFVMKNIQIVNLDY
ncbi:zinc finger BED domain-containing protein 4-like [Rhagoletis pomonella]|uniref:zinc finger BED domain-containing protein 4-like n=1 Tax=Rhagoletis pomonella TaxID=28610 RepID=UPI0017856BD2|nr:zinc finger BED domain-containing protein 4-like [Rhagoletis pomonella]